MGDGRKADERMTINKRGTDQETITMSGASYDYDGQGWCRDRGDADGRQPVSQASVLAACTTAAERNYVIERSR